MRAEAAEEARAVRGLWRPRGSQRRGRVSQRVGRMEWRGRGREGVKREKERTYLAEIVTLTAFSGGANARRSARLCELDDQLDFDLDHPAILSAEKNAARARQKNAQPLSKAFKSDAPANANDVRPEHPSKLFREGVDGRSDRFGEAGLIQVCVEVREEMSAMGSV